MSRAILPVALLFLLVLSLSGGCEFYTAGNPYDANLGDADRSDDAADVDSDGGPLDGTVVVDAAPPVDAAIEQCGQVGGVCTATPNAICPPGTRPHGDDESLDCGGHCCVPDQESDCSSNVDTNCTMNAECTGCWAPAQNATLQCFGGRPCCEWTCGG